MSKNKRVSMQSIADELGVSKVTVHKALNNQQYVSDEMRIKVLEKAEELGYQVKNKEPKKNNSFAFFVPKRFFLEIEYFYNSIFYYVKKKLENEKLDLKLYIINSDSENSLSLPQTYNPSTVDGIFIAGEIKEDYVKKLSSHSLPTILIDFYKPDVNLDCVISDNYLNGYNATNQLINSGHTKIGFVGNPEQTSSISDRYFGYQKALAQHRLTQNPEWLIVNNDETTGMYTLDFNLPTELPSAYVCHCDYAAYYLMQKLTAEGLSVPENVSIISFDNTKISETTAPGITSLNLSTKEFAESSVALMHERISNPTMPPKKVYVSSNIIIRDSIKEI